MIWTDGRLVDASEVTVSCLDRAFQHGLGLFETLATWNRRAKLLPRHLERLTASAAELGVPVGPAMLPDVGAVAQLIDQNVPTGEAKIRITLSGGLTSTTGSRLWMTAEPLETPPWRSLRLRSSWTVSEPSPLSRHKTLNYWRNRLIHEAAVRDGYDEDIARDNLGRFVEGTRTNLFIVRGAALLTPSADSTLLPGVFRSLVIALAPSAGLTPRELRGGLAMRDLSVADECFLTNSGRGIAPVEELDLTFGGLPTSLGFRGAEGVATCRLAARARDWLESEEDWP